VEFCYDYELVVSKTADTAYSRDWTCSISKDADQTALTLQQGQTFIVNFTVTNPAPQSVTVTVSDSLLGSNMGLNCGDGNGDGVVTIDAGGSRQQRRKWHQHRQLTQQRISLRQRTL
jgi:hypothetical protein